MSARALPRETGTIISCNECDAELRTANVLFGSNRAWARTQGWIRGEAKRKDGTGGKRRDLCPACAPAEKQKAADEKERKRLWHDRRALAHKAKDEKLKAKPTTQPQAEAVSA